MATTRESRIQPLVWYTLWEYKVYFVQLGEWYVKVFPRRWIPTKNPIFTFKGETKKKVVEQLDAHCMKTFGKKFRFKKAVHEAPVVVKKPTNKKKCVCWWYPEEVKKNAQEVTDGLLKFFVELVADMDTNKKLTIACLVTSGLSLLWVILLLIISL